MNILRQSFGSGSCKILPVDTSSDDLSTTILGVEVSSTQQRVENNQTQQLISDDHITKDDFRAQTLLKIKLPLLDEISRPNNEADTDYFPTLGVSVKWLSEFMENMKSLKNDKDQPFNELLTTNICDDIVKPITMPYRMSMCDLLHQVGHKGIGKATVFISHAWKYRFVDLVDALMTHFESKMDTIVWFDVFSVNQHATGIVRDFSWWSGTFQNAIKQFNHTVMVLAPWHDPIPLTRAWCLWELYSTVKMECKFEVAMSDFEKQSMMKYLEEDCHGSLNIMKALINVEYSESWDPNDRVQIVEAIKASGTTFQHLNREVFKTINMWIIDCLEAMYWEHEYMARLNERLIVAEILGHAYHHCGDYINSEKYHTIVIDERTLLPFITYRDYEALIRAIRNLAKLCQVQGKYDEAEEGFRSCLNIAEQNTQDKNHPNTITALSDMASLCQDMGKYDRAEEWFSMCLKSRQETLGEDHSETLTSMHNLAGVYIAQNKYEEALSLSLKCLEMRQKNFGRQHPHTVATINQLASLYQAQCKYDEALPLYEECLEIRQTLFGKQHPDTLESCFNLATIYQDQGKKGQGLSLYEKCLEIQLRVLGETHLSTLHSMEKVGSLYHEQGRLDEALPLFVKCVEMRSSVLGDYHPHTLIAINNLAKLYQDQRKYDEASPLLQQSVNINLETLGIAHPDTMIAAHNVAKLFQHQGNYDEALGWFVGCLDIQKSQSGEQDPRTLNWIHSLANCYQVQGKYDEALPLLLKCFESRKSVLGKEHLDTLSVMRDLECVYKAQGKHDEASSISA